MKRLILAAITLFAVGTARAAQSVFDVAYSTFAVTAVQLDSAPNAGVVVNSRPSSFSASIAKIRFVNPHPSWDIYVGDVNVSTDAFSANLGQVIKAAGGTADWAIDKDPKRNSVWTPIYARPADTASFEGGNRKPRLSVIFFGY